MLKKYRENRKWRRVESGKMADKKLLKLIKSDKNSSSLQSLACRKVKNKKALSELLFLGISNYLKKDICNQLIDLNDLTMLCKKAAENADAETEKIIAKRIDHLNVNKISCKEYNDSEILKIIEKSQNKQLFEAAIQHFSNYELLTKWLIENKTKNDLIKYLKEINKTAFETAIQHINNMDFLFEFYDEIRYRQNEKGEILIHLFISSNKSFDALLNLNLNYEASMLLREKISSQDDLLQLAELAKDEYTKRYAFKKLAEFSLANKDAGLAFKILMQGCSFNEKVIDELLKILKPDQRFELFNNSFDKMVKAVAFKSIVKTKKYQDQLDEQLYGFINNAKIEISGFISNHVITAGKTIRTIYEKKRCDICNGTGRMPYCDHGEKCDSCNGNGHDEVAVGQEVV